MGQAVCPALLLSDALDAAWLAGSWHPGCPVEDFSEFSPWSRLGPHGHSLGQEAEEAKEAGEAREAWASSPTRLTHLLGPHAEPSGGTQDVAGSVPLSDTGPREQSHPPTWLGK